MAGIDLGTSNSAIAFVENGGPRVIKPDMVSPVMPSVVFIDKRGGSSVGHTARLRMMTLGESEGTGHTRWKPHLGQDHRYFFPAAKQTKSGPELSGLVIRALLDAHTRETSEELASCVVTIPAKFEQAANDATRTAARNAGLEHATLLKEPIAAALAYGFSSSDSRANWMVFDLGGGTLDVCLMAVRDGQLSVLQGGQSGDQHLGGANFDRALFDFVLGPKQDNQQLLSRYQQLQTGYEPLRKQYRLEDFSEKSNRIAFHRLMLAVEDAKIQLSRKKTAEVLLEADEPLCTDGDGTPVEVHVEVTRSAYERLISSDVERAVNICQMLLTNNRMTSKDIDQVILVGGPTKTPYLQEVLSDRLKIDLNVEVDPMTAVAIGASLQAEIDDPPTGRKKRPVTTTEGIEIELQYDRSSQQPACTVAGVIAGPASTAGMTVEITRDDGAWTSGKLPIDESGFFTTELLLLEKGSPHQSVFTTRVNNAEGSQVAGVEEPRVWHPMPTASGTLTNSIDIAVTGNQTITLLEKDQPLPARGRTVVQTAYPIRRGSSDDFLRIPVIEAVTNFLGVEDRDHADAHLKYGELLVAGDHQRMNSDLPKGSEIELTVDIDASQQITIVAYVERLGDEFEAVIQRRAEAPSLDDIEGMYSREKRRLDEVRLLHQRQAADVVETALKAIDNERALDAIESGLDRVRDGEEVERMPAVKRILQLRGTINQCWNEQIHPRLLHRLEQIQSGASEQEHSSDAAALKDAVVKAASQAGDADLRRLEGEVEDLDIQVRYAPFHRLLLYILALQGLRVSQHQYEVHDRAGDYANELLAKGAPDTLTSDDLAQIETWNQKLDDAYPELQQHVAAYREKADAGSSVVDSFGSTVARKS